MKHSFNYGLIAKCIVMITMMMLVTLSVNIITFAESAVGSASVDWENDILSGKGYGIPKEGAKNPGQARIWAHQAAMLDAYRRLAESAKGIHVTASSTIEDNISTGDIVSGDVDAVVKRARVVSENYDEWGNCSVELEVPLYGVTNSIAKVALKPLQKEAFPEPSLNISVSVDTNSSTSVKVNGGYTGLVVDCSGLGLNPVMSPVIFNAEQKPIYGYKNLDYNKVIANGMASYANSMNGNISRAGSNPLVVKATSIVNHNGNPVVSTEDANRILMENKSSHFLDNCAVVFIK